jgi:hypothetical protein
MFSRYRHAPAAAATLVCLSWFILSAAFLTEVSHAKTPVTAVVQCGDPDEFETRVSDPEMGGGGKAPMSSDASGEGTGGVSKNGPKEETAPSGGTLPFEYRDVERALRRLIVFVTVELDLM